MMDHGAAPVPLETLRAAVREMIGARSLRDAASEIGISHTGLRGFLHGATPHRHTRLKLERWLAGAGGRVREPARSYPARSGPHTFELAIALVRALAAGADPDLAPSAERGLRDLLRKLYRNAGVEPPPWLRGDGRPD